MMARPAVWFRERSRAAVLVVLPAGLLLLAGCSQVPFLHRGSSATSGSVPTAARPIKPSKPTASKTSARKPKQGEPAKPNATRPGNLTLRDHAAVEPTEPYWPFRIAQMQFAADSLPEAESSLRDALRRDPGYAPALALLSKLYFVTSRNQEAVTLLEPVLQNPDGLEARDRELLLAGLALHQQALGNDPGARAALAGLKRRDLDHAGSAMVYVMLRGDRPDSALEVAAATLDQGPSNPVNLNNYGITRLRAGDVEGARRAFLSAIDRDPTLPGPYYNLAILNKFYLLDDGAAADSFKRYWSRSHDDPDSLAAVFGRQ